MPEISRFLGIVIKMFYKDHNPPHFHVEYQEYKAVIRISDFALMEGKLPPKIHGLVIEWSSLHHEELNKDWTLAKNQSPLFKIDPLE
jgi:hypothetical protein